MQLQFKLDFYLCEFKNIKSFSANMVLWMLQLQYICKSLSEEGKLLAMPTMRLTYVDRPLPWVNVYQLTSRGLTVF